MAYDPYLQYVTLYNQQKKTTPSNKLTVQEKRLSAEGQALIAQQFSFFMDNLKATEQQIIKMFQEQMGAVDPATQMALAQIRESAEMARNAMNEEMNRRGLLQSPFFLKSSKPAQHATGPGGIQYCWNLLSCKR